MRERRPFHQLLAIAEDLLERHMTRCRNLDEDPASKAALHATLRQIEEEVGYDAPDVEARAVGEYLEAALGHALKRRPHIRIWQDSKGGIRHTPPPWPDDPGPQTRREQMKLYTAEDELREAGVRR